MRAYNNQSKKLLSLTTYFFKNFQGFFNVLVTIKLYYYLVVLQKIIILIWRQHGQRTENVNKNHPQNFIQMRSETPDLTEYIKNCKLTVNRQPGFRQKDSYTWHLPYFFLFFLLSALEHCLKGLRLLFLIKMLYFLWKSEVFYKWWFFLNQYG